MMNMRIGGLASGMDTETMISDLMKAQRTKLDKITKQKQYVEWQRDDYRAANLKLFNFRNLTSDTMVRQSTFIQKTATSSAPDEVGVKNISSVNNFSGTINVEQLAEKATMRSTDRVNGSSTPIDVNAKLSTLDPALGSSQTITIKAMKEDGTLQTDKEAFTFTFNPNEKSMQDVLDEINKSSNVSAFYDSYSGKISMTAKNSGENAKGAEIIMTSSSEFQNFTKLSVDNDAAETAGVGSKGKNAKFTLDGLSTERNTNTFIVNGFELNLKQASKKDITFSSTTDTDKILGSVTKFVEEYNKLIENLNGEIREKKDRDYQPLTELEKKDLSEEQVKSWEEKARSGTLRNDSIISSALTKMRSALSSSVEGITGANTLSAIGITTSSNFAENGKLIIDEAKLREAISSNPTQVYELFSANGTTADQVDSKDGIARRLVTILDDTRKQIISKAGSDSSVNTSFALGRSLNNYDSQINSFEDRLTRIEDRYWKQFGAMEKAIQKANAQYSQLSNYFSTGA